MSHRALPLPLITILLLAWGAAVAQRAAVPTDRLDAYLGAQVEALAVPGLAVAVTGPEGILYARGFGTTRAGGGTAVTPATPFEIGSLVKSMTALAVLQLADEGRLDLDAPVRSYLPWFRLADEEASARITLRHLLTHTSGLPTSSHAVVWRDSARSDASTGAAVRALATVEPRSEPGEAFAYANMGYATLGAVIESVTGRAWRAYVQEEILEPLGMDGATTSLEERAALDEARPHTWRLARLVPVGPVAPSLAPAGSDAVASVEAMARYLQAWLAPEAHDAIPEGAVEAAFDARVPSGGGESYGMGWGTQARHGAELVYHTGGTAGSSSYMSVLPESGYGVVVLGNAFSAAPVALGMGVNDVLLGAEPAAVGLDPMRAVSVALSALGAIGLLLLAGLAARLVRVARRGRRPRRRRALALRAAVLLVVAGLVVVGAPRLPGLLGMPYPYGIRGYSFDVLFAVGASLAASVGWALHALVTLVRARRSQRDPGRGGDADGGRRVGPA